MVTHTGKVFEIGSSADGAATVYYAHGSESLRTYLGKSKFHSSPDCRMLLRTNLGKSIIKEWRDNMLEHEWCKICRADR